MRQKLQEFHLSLYGLSSKELVYAKVPGKVNLIGNHIDYNDGFVMPIGIDKYIYGSASIRNDFKVNIYSDLYHELRTIDLYNIEKDENKSWINYPSGIIKVLIDSGYQIKGADIVLLNDLPANSGLGSSAAVEVIVGFLLLTLSGESIDRKKLALLCKEAENGFVGVNCGIMDQFTSALSKNGSILFIDCVDYSFEQIPFDENRYAIVICDTKKNRSLASSEYNKRREESRKGFDMLKLQNPEINSFRDITLDQIDELMKSDLDQNALKRLEHIVGEIKRVKKSREFLLNNDYVSFGELMSESHLSSKNFYEVSCNELDMMQVLSLKFPGVLGSRLTGAGFGGCVVNLMERYVSDIFKDYITKEYSKSVYVDPDIMIVNTSDGVMLL